MTEDQKLHIAALIEALRDSKRYPKDPNGRGKSRSLDGMLWSFQGVAADVYHNATGNGSWVMDQGHPQYNIGPSWHLRFPGDRVVFITKEYFGIDADMLVKEWMADPSNHPTPLRAHWSELDRGNSFELIATALENTYLKEIPATVRGLKKQSTKGHSEYKPGRSPFEKSALAFQ